VGKKLSIHAMLPAVASGQLPVLGSKVSLPQVGEGEFIVSWTARSWAEQGLVLRFTKTLTNKIEGFIFQFRRKPQRYP
jgi:hypothetical protein